MIVCACFCVSQFERVCRNVLTCATFDGDGRCASALAQLPTLTTSTLHKCLLPLETCHNFDFPGGIRDENN